MSYSFQADEATEIECSVQVIDPGMGDTHDFIWNFGDGGIDTTNVPNIKPKKSHHCLIS